MTQKVALTLADSASTPESPGTPAAANRSFVPGAMEQGYVHTFYNTTTGTSPAALSKLSVSLSPAGPNKPVSRIKLGLGTPKTQTIDGLVVVDHVNRCFVEFVFDENSTRDDRLDIRSLMINTLADAGVLEMVKNLEDLW
jgi:hypothetical protein